MSLSSVLELFLNSKVQKYLTPWRQGMHRQCNVKKKKFFVLLQETLPLRIISYMLQLSSFTPTLCISLYTNTHLHISTQLFLMPTCVAHRRWYWEGCLNDGSYEINVCSQCQPHSTCCAHCFSLAVYIYSKNQEAGGRNGNLSQLVMFLHEGT